jgi:hypothetical protein
LKFVTELRSQYKVYTSVYYVRLVNMEQLVKWEFPGEAKELEENQFQYSFATTNPIWTHQGSKPGQCGGRNNFAIRRNKNM